MKSKLEIASEIIDIDKRQNAGGLQPLKLYKGKIEGNLFSKTSNWWSIYKGITEGVDNVKPSLISERVCRGWTEEEAIGAYVCESLQKYRRRINEKGKEHKERVELLMNRFIYGAAA
jgi:hypothetical protein